MDTKTKLIGSELPLVERLRKMQGMGDYQLAALMDGVGPQAADEIERLRKDAERYRWIVDNCVRADPKMDGLHLWFGSIRPMKGGTFDAAIDEAIRARK